MFGFLFKDESLSESISQSYVIKLNNFYCNLFELTKSKNIKGQASRGKNECTL